MNHTANVTKPPYTLTPEQIAYVTGMSMGTVKAHLSDRIENPRNMAGINEVEQLTTAIKPIIETAITNAVKSGSIPSDGKAVPALPVDEDKLQALATRIKDNMQGSSGMVVEAITAVERGLQEAYAGFHAVQKEAALAR